MREKEVGKSARGKIPTLLQADKCTRIAKIGAAWNTYLQIDHQSFCVVEQTTRRRAEWFRKNLSAALGRLLANSTPPQKAEKE